ncbi:hypothetical protein OG943_34720 [Amycolatopsis sp. NBC_00345]|uniref:hypothetical protein n=1 Tax=Amycolatopsis sp. NBC_00345 TaxID=2975955 RepID=UPI002E26A734
MEVAGFGLTDGVTSVLVSTLVSVFVLLSTLVSVFVLVSTLVLVPVSTLPPVSLLVDGSCFGAVSTFGSGLVEVTVCGVGVGSCRSELGTSTLLLCSPTVPGDVTLGPDVGLTPPTLPATAVGTDLFPDGVVPPAGSVLGPLVPEFCVVVLGFEFVPEFVLVLAVPVPVLVVPVLVFLGPAFVRLLLALPGPVLVVSVLLLPVWVVLVPVLGLPALVMPGPVLVFPGWVPELIEPVLGVPEFWLVFGVGLP